MTVVVLAAVLVGGWLGVRQWNANPIVAIPTPRMPSPNALDFYVRAARSLSNQKEIDAQVKHPFSSEFAQQASRRAIVAANASALATVRQGFAYAYLNPPARSINDEFPYYGQERELARLLAIEAQVKQEQGDWGGAMDSDMDAVRLGADVPHGGVIMSDLVGIACQALGRRRLWDMVGHLTAPQARQAARHLEAIQARRVSLADVLQEEKWFGQSTMMRLVSNPKWKAIDFWHSKRASMNNYTRYMDVAITSARKPYASGHQDPPMPTDLMSNLLVPVITAARPKHTDNETQNALLITAFALRAYRLEHGSYPESLAPLAPRYLAHVPDDPFALSSPVRYRRVKAAYVLYSLGPDGKEDGGTAIRDVSKTGLWRYLVVPDSRGDIVAGRNP